MKTQSLPSPISFPTPPTLKCSCFPGGLIHTHILQIIRVNGLQVAEDEFTLVQTNGSDKTPVTMEHRLQSWEELCGLQGQVNGRGRSVAKTGHAGLPVGGSVEPGLLPGAPRLNQPRALGESSLSSAEDRILPRGSERAHRH